MKPYFFYGLNRILRPWKIPSRVPTYLLISTIIFTNCLVIFLYNANSVVRANKRNSLHIKYDSRMNSEPGHRKILHALSAILANVSGEVRDGKISVRVLSHLLDRFKDKDEEIEASYIDQVLQTSNLTYDMGWPAICKNLTDSGKTGSALFGFKKLTSAKKEGSSSQEAVDSKGLEFKSLGTSNNLTLVKDKEGTKSLPQADVGYTCGRNNTLLNGSLKALLIEKTPQMLEALFTTVKKGGHHTPENCIPKEKTAIIIPYRNRFSHLHILLLNLFPFLIRQGVDFTVFIIEQVLPGPFNRGMLINVGFLEALKLGKFDCFIFHDVDIIPINDLNLYHCHGQSPIHYVAGVNKFGYRLLYKDMFGGVVAFTKEQFEIINGASNLYFGWGGEDDDMKRRVVGKGYKLLRKINKHGRYDMIKHELDETNQKNPVRSKFLKSATKRQDIEGLNTTHYQRLKVELLPLYTWVTVNISMTNVLETAPSYMSKEIEKLREAFNVIH